MIHNIKKVIETLQLVNIEYDCVFGEDDEFGQQKKEENNKVIEQLKEFFDIA